ncbi:hypothetical protein ATN88_04095 [Enterovibrio coralii]|uniref:DUF3592 domain-containing protein n=1 Tax=Enterovibrio coralii TaxID=294935 RepID=A0A135IBZ0_9GAMM|nr:hypothetical protein ATN88_04095 [Enterovibrio coralii]
MNISPEEKKGLVKFGLTIGTIPVAIAAAIFFDNGGQILTAWFAGIVGLAGIFALRTYAKERKWKYELVEGEIAGATHFTHYGRQDESVDLNKPSVSFNAVFYFNFRGWDYLVEHTVSMNYPMMVLLRFKTGKKVTLWVPVHNPSLARLNSPFGRYQHLSLAIVFGFVSSALWYFVFTSDFLPA